MTDITVNLNKTRGESLGIGFKKLPKPPHCEVSILVDNGVAAASGQIQEGDLLLGVNGINVQHLSPSEVGGVLARHSTDPTITLELRRQVTNGNMNSLSSVVQCLTNGHPTIVVDSHSPPATPEYSSPIPDGSSQENASPSISPSASPSVSPVMGRRRNPRVRRSNALAGGGALPEIQEGVGESEGIPKSLNLNIHSQPTHRHSLTPEVIRNPIDNIKHAAPLRGSKSLDLANLPQWRAGSAAQSITVHNLLDGHEMSDRLHTNGIKEYKVTGCSDSHCKGSFMQLKPKRPYGSIRPKEEIIPLANDFIKQYYESKKLALGADYEVKLAGRLYQVEQDIELRGHYDLTYEELVFGARTAWRNAPRCVNRIVWRQLEVLDARHAVTPKDMFEAICHHIKYANNGGNLRSTITVFPNRIKPYSDFRVWNVQLIGYAGYKNPDGSILGDPAKVEFTEMIMEYLHWQPPAERTAFDLLPLVLQANGGDPEMFDIPPEIVLEVTLSHPEYDWFKDMGLKWYALPAVSCLLLDCGGLEFPGIPFNGWYMGTEIARDLGDVNRYNLLKPIAQKMGLNTQTYKLWKDRAIVELNVSVLHSFQKANISIVDHHSTTESFITHMKSEIQTRGGCPADWVWIVPPISGSVTPVFHQEMLLYNLSPSYEYQYDPWKYHSWQPGRGRARSGSLQGANKFKRLANMVKIQYRMYRSFFEKRIKATVLFATETGRARNYANVVKDVFGRVFAAKVCCMEDYDKANLEHEQLVIIVTSTFGSGDPPANGEVFGRYLLDMRNGTVAPPGVQTAPTPRSHRMSTIVAPTAAMLDASKTVDSPLTQVKYAVFGLGSRAYPNFCTFAHTCDNLMKDLGAEMIYPCGEGDELCGQEESFQMWLQQCYLRACEVYSIDPEKTEGDLQGYKAGYMKDNYRVQTYGRKLGDRDICAGLKSVHKKSIQSFTLKARSKLQSPASDRSTILVVLDTNQNKVHYDPGDHIAIYPQNSAKLVNEVITCLNSSLDPDAPIYVESRRVSHTEERWVEENRMPVPVTLREALTHYLDISNPPSPQFIKLLAKHATRSTEQEELNELAKGGDKYEDWKYEKFPNMVDVLSQFHSLKIDVTLLLQQLPLLQCRYYSISSSPKMSPNEVHATVAIVSFKKRKGLGPRHNGVCSTWLNTIKVGTKVPCVIRQAHAFHMPEDPRTPIIMVGPGTGIAPYRSFWHQRAYMINESLKRQMTLPSPLKQPQVNASTLSLTRPALSEPGPRRRRKTAIEPPKLTLLQAPLGAPSRNTASTGTPMKRSLSDTDDNEIIAKLRESQQKQWGSMSLYFGCRRSDMDFIYKDELMRAKVSGALTDVHVAFSRELRKPKTYVQHLLKENAEKIVKQLMEERGHFYVCGDISMAADVCRTLQGIFEENAAMSGDQARRLIEGMKDRGVYHEDIFGVTLKHQEVTNRVRTAAKKAWRILVTASDTGHPLQSPMTPNLRMPSPSPMGSRQFPALKSSDSSYDSSTLPSSRSPRTHPKRPTVTVLIPATPPDGKQKPLDRSSPDLPSHGKASLQTGISIDDKFMMKGNKLITIEEPEKSILEPLGEVPESPQDAPPLLGEKPRSISPMPSISESEGDVEAKTGSDSGQGQDQGQGQGPGEDATEPLVAEIKKSPLTRKRSGRIRTRSKVETAI